MDTARPCRSKRKGQIPQRRESHWHMSAANGGQNKRKKEHNLASLTADTNVTGAGITNTIEGRWTRSMENPLRMRPSYVEESSSEDSDDEDDPSDETMDSLPSSSQEPPTDISEDTELDTDASDDMLIDRIKKRRRVNRELTSRKMFENSGGPHCAAKGPNFVNPLAASQTVTAAGHEGKEQAAAAAFPPKAADLAAVPQPRVNQMAGARGEHFSLPNDQADKMDVYLYGEKPEKCRVDCRGAPLTLQAFIPGAESSPGDYTFYLVQKGSSGFGLLCLDLDRPLAEQGVVSGSLVTYHRHSARTRAFPEGAKHGQGINCDGATTSSVPSSRNVGHAILADDALTAARNKGIATRASCVAASATTMGGAPITSANVGQHSVPTPLPAAGTPPSSSPTISYRRNIPWSNDEVLALANGVCKFGEGRWKAILASSAALKRRSSVQLKDKWRNIRKAMNMQVHARTQHFEGALLSLLNQLCH
ncbi:unnamed protein product [Ostreobium quekettii]|uniref:Myb-like domain-containing protein n=1 Tax=Ostreobium quekettii TaxID=121088 RepID=A0A8S1IND1_9CHLO|nr:unnamed protein product [Ostreobium quekettii]|eukprot:evm.model.scf_94.5 EVM.evm.TU.scf_94.5   scf_94:34053-39265(-)